MLLALALLLSPASAQSACDLDRDGYLAADPTCGGSDCDDADPSVHPGAPERPGDGLDSDCDGLEQCHADDDADGFGGPVRVLSRDLRCLSPGVAPSGGDCDDSDARINPAATESPADGLDQDCDGLEACFVDQDGDAYGGPRVLASPDLSCRSRGLSDRGDDCDDVDPRTHPGAPDPIGDGIDQDCDGVDGLPLLWSDLPRGLTAGADAAFGVELATPGARVVLVAGGAPGSTPVPGCPGLDLPFAHAIAVDRDLAGPTGEAELLVTPPRAAAGQRIGFVAVERDTCRATRPVGYVVR